MNIITSLNNTKMTNDKPLTYDEIGKWATEKMNNMLGMESKEMVQYVLSMDTNTEIQTYLEELLGTTKKVQTFIEQLIKKLNSLPRRVVPKISQPSNQMNNQKKKNNTTTTTTNNSTTKSKPIKQTIGSFSEIEIEMRPGEPCECQATRHKLITNCLNCGKVICEQEGKGPCKFCSTPLFTNPINLSTQQQQLVEKNLNSAVEYKDRILGYQNTHAKRTMVFDDQEDYFSNSSNKWLSEKERDTVAKQEAEFKQKQLDHKKTVKISIDFQGRRIVSAQPESITFEKLSFTNSNNSGNGNGDKKEYKSIQEIQKDNSLGKDVKYTTKKREEHNNNNIILGNGNDDLITKQYYGVEEDIVVFNSKSILSNSKLKTRGIMEGLWSFDSLKVNNNKKPKTIPNISNYIKLLKNLQDNSCNFISISPQNYQDEEYQFLKDPKLISKLPSKIYEFLKQLIDLNKKISGNGGGEEGGGIKINISILFPREFEFSLDESLEIVKSILKLYTSLGIKSFSLILPSGFNDTFTQPIVAPTSTKSDVNNSKSYSQTQTLFLGKLNQHFKNTLEFIVCPSMFELNLNSGTPPPSRQQIEYWLEINKSTPAQYSILFTTLSGTLQNSTLSKIKNIFDKRDLIVIEKYPYKNIGGGTTMSIQWDAYHPQFDDYKSFLSGVVASPFDAQHNLDDLTTLITLSTTFIQYLKSPFNYSSELSLRANLVSFTDNNEEIADDLSNLIIALSNGIFDQIHLIVKERQQDKLNNPQQPTVQSTIDIRDKIFFENLIGSTSRVLDYFKTLPHDHLVDHLNLIKSTLLYYIN